MSDHDCLSDFFMYPRVEKGEALRFEIQRLARLQEGLPPGLQEGLLDLMNAVEHLRHFSHLAQHLTPIEFMLLCMLSETGHRLRVLEGKQWIHPPFP